MKLYNVEKYPLQLRSIGMSNYQVIFNISQCFTINRVVGRGSYGIVCSGIYEPTKTEVAIKKVEPFGKALFCKRTLREIRLLKKFRHHENIVGLYDLQTPPSFDSFNEVYMIFEYMPTDLGRVIAEQKLSPDHIRYFTYQLLRGLKFIHSAGVIHRDIKPQNLLVNQHCDLKICDFGLSRLDRSLCVGLSTTVLTEYVATRWYRAPEVMLTRSLYSRAMDMWSVGCILGEMLVGQAIFCGKDYRHQLMLILSFLGTPNSDELAFIELKYARAYLTSLPLQKRKDWYLFFAGAEPDAVDLITWLLRFDPSGRLTAEEALSHNFLHPYHLVTDEPGCSPVDIEKFYFDFPLGCTAEELKKELYKEATELNPLEIF